MRVPLPLGTRHYPHKSTPKSSIQSSFNRKCFCVDLGVVARDVIPHSLRLPEVRGQGQAALLPPLQQLQSLLSIVRLGHCGGRGVLSLLHLDTQSVKSLRRCAYNLCEDASCAPGTLSPARRRLVGGGDLGPGPRPEPAIDQARLE